MAKPAQPAAAPLTTPEPRFQIGEDPQIIFQDLIASSSKRRRNALVELRWKDAEKYAEDPTLIGDARSYRINLDDDPQMEGILMFNVGIGQETQLLIFKNTGGTWWCVGKFRLWYHWVPDQADHMLELRNIVDFDHKDIIIRLTGGGSDIEKEIELSIYRLYGERLYRIFKTTEEFALRRLPEIEYERNSIYYPEPQSGGSAYIVLHHSKESMPASEWGVIDRPRNIVDCVPYRWASKDYIFVPDKSASARFCQAGAARRPPGRGQETYRGRRAHE